ncbi:MAG: NADH:ubiquinone reductase (Na(+)-transporting) subunit C [Gammaproteobacteria bacterium]
MADSALSENPLKALGITMGVALVCAILVSIAAVGLKPRYLDNLEAERASRLGAILNAVGDVSVPVSMEDVEARIVDLQSGLYSDDIDPVTFDQRKAANDPNQGIKRRANNALVYLLRDESLETPVVMLPVWGVGYQSALYGFLAVQADQNRVIALRFYEHGETPGLGSRIQDPQWEALWKDKKIYDDNGAVAIGVTNRPGSDAEYQVDGISGATRTSMGVDGLVRFWLGEFGFGPYLARLRQGEV